MTYKHKKAPRFFERLFKYKMLIKKLKHKI